MTLDLQQQANRRMRRLVLVLVGVVVFLVAVVVALVTSGGGKAPSSDAAPQQSPSAVTSAPASPVASPSAGTGTGYVAPARWVALPSGTKTVNGLPQGFPQTPEGAVAMLVASIRSGWSLDPARASAAARAYALPGQAGDAAALAAEATARLRSEFGLPTTGAVPQGATLSVAPIGVQWKAYDAGSVQVSVLVREVVSAGGGQPAVTRLYSTTGLVAWLSTVHDWRELISGPITSPDPHDIGSPGFNAAGWTAIQEGDH